MIWLIVLFILSGGLYWYTYRKDSTTRQIESELGLSGELEAKKVDTAFKGPFEFQPKPDSYDIREKIKAAYPTAIITINRSPLSTKIKLHHDDGSVTVADGKDTHDANRVLALKLGVTE